MTRPLVTLYTLLLLVIHLLSDPSASWAASALSTPTFASKALDRRSAIATAVSAPFLLAPRPASSVEPGSTSPPPAPAIARPNPRAITAVRLDSPKQSAGLELHEVDIGTPRRNVVAVLSVRAGGEGARSGAQKGMILLDYANIEGALKRISDGPYPIELRLYNLALGGDAVGDLGRSIVSPDDALELAESVGGGGNSGRGGKAEGSEGLAIDVVRKAGGECSIKSRRGDLMQIRYDARIGDGNGELYDSSNVRGTGQPYAYQLGNGDVLRGVDLGTYDMCPGEVRELSIPPELGYPNGSRLYKQIPPNSRLFWRVELAELNFIKEGDNDTPRDDVEGRF